MSRCTPEAACHTSERGRDGSMGFIFRRQTTLCLTCKTRLLKTKDRERCEAAGHRLKVRVSPKWWIAYKTDDGWQRETTNSEHKIDAERALRDKEGAIDRGQHAGRWSFEDAKKAALLDYKVNKRRSIDV